MSHTSQLHDDGQPWQRCRAPTDIAKWDYRCSLKATTPPEAPRYCRMHDPQQASKRRQRIKAAERTVLDAAKAIVAQDPPGLYEFYFTPFREATAALLEAERDCGETAPNPH